MRIVNFILVVMFLVFAFLQVNDPDPVVWILIYGMMAAVCVMAIFEFYPRKILIALAAAYLIYSVYYFPGVRVWLTHDDKVQLFDNVAKMEHPFIEESREFLGLMINVAVLIFYIVRSYRK